MRSVLAFIVGLVIGILVTLMSDFDSCTDKRIRIDAYRLCMESGPQCHMEIRHFVQYHKLKEELKSCPAIED